MATYLLAWNPDRWHWSDLNDVVKRVAQGELVLIRWSCGSTRRIARGDRVFLIRLGQEPRGIFGSGTVAVEPYEDIHWDPDKANLGESALFIQFQIDALLDPEQETIMWRERLLGEARFSGMHWDTQISGISIPDDVASELEMAWFDLVDVVEFGLPEQVVNRDVFLEGATREITINSYERDRSARRRCIEKYGTTCRVCHISLMDLYGAVGEGLIHVHHLKSLADIGEEYEVDPIQDMIPVCPNCHAIIHSRRPAYSIDEVRQFLTNVSNDINEPSSM